MMHNEWGYLFVEKAFLSNKANYLGFRFHQMMTSIPTDQGVIRVSKKVLLFCIVVLNFFSIENYSCFFFVIIFKLSLFMYETYHKHIIIIVLIIIFSHFRPFRWIYHIQSYLYSKNRQWKMKIWFYANIAFNTVKVAFVCFTFAALIAWIQTIY